MAVRVDDDPWVQALDVVVGALDGLPLGDVQARCALARAKFEAVEARRLAAEVRADGDTSRARRLAGAGGSRSKKAARAAAARAAAVSKNPSLADDLDSGELSDEQLDTIAGAAEDDESLATDEEFINGVKKRTVDQGKKFARDRATRSKQGESQAQRQRRLRIARRYDDRAAGLSSITMSGDDATIDELWRLIRQREKQLREADGGRDLPRSDHVRTLDQRLFDAMADLLRGTARPVGRPSTVVVVPVDGPAHSAGSGPISDDVARDLLERSGVSVQLVDRLTGQPLWLGRSARHASDAQFLALIVRDQGCVLCGADWIGCEVHHLTPWNAPAEGETDIDKLALLCSDDHHHLHQAGLTLERLDDCTWKTRPATADEIAPARPFNARSDDRRQRGAPEPSEPAGSRAQVANNRRRSVDMASTDNPAFRPRPGQRRQPQAGGCDDDGGDGGEPAAQA